MSLKLTNLYMWKQQSRVQSMMIRITKTTNVTPIAAPRYGTSLSVGSVILSIVVASAVVGPVEVGGTSVVVV